MSEIAAKRRQGRFGRLLVLCGARQVGKTTLVRRVFQDHAYISVEDPAVRPAFSSLSAPDWIRRYPVAIIDEVQKTPTVVETIKAAYDQDESVRYVLLGSSRLLLMEQVRESLAGRARLIDLWPLTLPEMLSQEWDDKRQPSRLARWMLNGCRDPESLVGIPAAELGYAYAVEAWDRYLTFGGMPVLHHEDLSSDDRWVWLKDYQKTYLERDVRDLAAFRDLEPFVLAQQVLAQRSGKALNFSDAARVAGVAPNTLRRFLRYLEMSYQVLLLPPFHRNTEKRLSKAPKLHFLDPGILRAVTGRREGELTGEEFESAVVSEIHKQIQTADLHAGMTHLRTHDGREVDLLVELETGYLAIEIKQTRRVSAVDARALRGLERLLDRPLLGRLLISRDPEIRDLGDNILAVPAPWILS